jgi:radical SAM superfamily enzyme YgiQ (UPF0313 family)
MASRILLISTNCCTTPDPVFPLGLAHLSAALRQAGHGSRWFDCQFASLSPAEVLRDYRPDVVGISVRNIDDVLIRKRETFFDGLAQMCRDIRRAQPSVIVLGGSGFSIFPRQLLELSGADFGVQGEGEASLPALVSALGQGGEYRSIPGLVHRQGGEIIVNAPALSGPETLLTAADRPADLMAHYLARGGMLNLQTQRGCRHGCSYCTYPLIEGRAHRRRPPEAVAEEMAQLRAAGARYAFIVDSVFNSSPQHVVETCEALIRRRLAMPWGCFLRPQGLTAELVGLMARAGLAHIEFGSDSFCDAVLAACGKQMTFEDILESSDLARKAHLDVCHFLIAGGPGETRATLEEGFSNSQRLKGAVILAVAGMRVYPGTDLFKQALSEGRIQGDADLLEPTYYLAPGLAVEAVFGQLEEFARRAPNWIVGDPDPAYKGLVARLRQRGVAGPLWSYFAMLQRLRPQAIAGEGSR